MPNHLYLILYSVTHGIVDGACAALIFGTIGKASLEPGYFAQLVILYNVLAFGLQAPLGALFDRLKKPSVSAAAGCIMIVLSILLIKHPFTAVCFAGIGNALFHIGGGMVSLNMSKGRAAIPGIFVAPGALGLAAGALVGKNGYFPVWYFAVLLIAAVLPIIFIKYPDIKTSIQRGTQSGLFEVMILLLLLSISIRSLIGLVLVFPWKSNLLLLMLLTLAVVMGKALGGILADRYGWIRVSIIGLMISAPLLAFTADQPLLAMLGVFAFNLTMPVTLTAISNMLPGRAGFAFGLTTLALLGGALPTFTTVKGTLNQPLIIGGVIGTSILALYAGLRLYSVYDKPRATTQSSSMESTGIESHGMESSHQDKKIDSTL